MVSYEFNFFVKKVLYIEIIVLTIIINFNIHFTYFFIIYNIYTLFFKKIYCKYFI